MLTYPMEERGSLPLYEYLCRRIRADILSGALPAGTRCSLWRTPAIPRSVRSMTPAEPSALPSRWIIRA